MSRVTQQDEMLPEYLAEVVEHAENSADALRRLLECDTEGVEREQLLDAVFRAFHTIKGLSAVVQREEIEHVAEHCESLLRLRARTADGLGNEALQALMSSAESIAQRVRSLRDGVPESALPSVNHDDLERSINTLRSQPDSVAARAETSREHSPSPLLSRLPSEIAGKLGERELREIDDGVGKGQRLFHARFAPSAEMHASGVTIASVMRSIGERGRLLRNIPNGTVVDGVAHVEFNLLFLAEHAAEDLRPLLSHLGLTIVELTAVRQEDAGGPGTQEREQAPAAAASQTAPASPAAGPSAPPSDEAQQHVVIRIGLPKLDEIMRLTGELMIIKSHLLSGLQQLANMSVPRELSAALLEDGQRLERSIRTLREAILETRLVPVREAFYRLPLVLRDILRDSEKQVRLTFSGEDIELDRMIVERLVDPLIHLVRNAFDHGVELPADRVARGKDALATIHIGAERDGGYVRIDVRDDGAGVSIDAILAKARALGLPAPDAASCTMSDALALLCRPGFTTQQTATRISGRGVGMDVVAHNVAALNGMLLLDSRAGEGSCFSMKIPLTLTVTDAVLIRASGQVFAVPVGIVQETVLITPEDVSCVERGRIARVRDEVLPVLSMHDLYRLPERCTWEEAHPCLLTSMGNDRVLILVDALLGRQEVVIKALNDPLVRVAGVIGAAEIGGGTVALILDLPGMLTHIWSQRHVV
ncbi:MAG TPA: chemotaxis protein CheA [Bacteroidota bacterium]|nr:chemotaxis protein CheA [Bacteroidota bacterium]